MKTLQSILIAAGILLAATNILAQEKEFPKLAGPYLGQKPPGMTPEIFAQGIVSTDGMQGKLFVTPDGSEILYMSIEFIPGQGNDPAGRKISFISIKSKNGLWAQPEIIPFSKEYTNDEPSLTYDGKKLFFVSIRPLEGKTEPEKMPDIWMVNRTGERWGNPMNMGPPVNTDDVEVQPFYSVDDKLYFGRRDGIYYSQYENGKYRQPVKLDEEIFRGRLSGICISPDNNILVLHSNNPGGRGGWDLYGSFRKKSGHWSQMVNLGNIVNSSQNEANATFSPDGKYLFFTRGDDIYWVSAKILDDLKPKE